MTKNWRSILYILGEILPSFFLGLFVFIGILLMFQVLRLTEFVLVHGVEISTVLEMVLFMSVSFVPAILPMSVVFSVLMSYGRLSTDSEIVAMKSLGIGMGSIAFPAALVGLLVAAASAVSAFYIGPWGNRQFEVLISDVGNQKVVASVREGAFAEGFYDLVVYVNQIDSKQGILKDVFIYDERKEALPLTIIAKKGIILKNPAGKSSSVLRLADGSIHRTTQDLYTKINFKTYDLYLSNPTNTAIRDKSPQSLKLDELRTLINSKNLDKETYIRLSSEFHKRWSITFACFVFAIFGVGLGTITQRRNQKASGFVLSIALIVTYWIFHIGMESVARNGHLKPYVALWIPSLAFFTASIYTLRKKWNS